MATPEFVYQDPYPLSKDDTPYRLLSKEHVSLTKFDGKDVLKIEPEALTLLANEAIRDVSFLLRTPHLKKVAAILKDPEASDNDRYVALAMLRNADTSSKGILPFCQDTGTATVFGKKGQQVWTGVKDEEYLAKGIYKTYTEEHLRYSQTAPLNMYDEVDTGTNLPAQIDLMATEGMEYQFLFVTKGGGSANKTSLYQETKALLNPASLEKFLTEKMKTLGTAGCPPYHLVFVVGGTSAEACLKTVKLGTTGYLDHLPTSGNAHGRAFRDVAMEEKMLQAAYKSGYGAQFGGKYFALDVRVIRLPRHGASCPVGMGVSCSADRNIKAKINRDGIWLEDLEREPGRHIPEEHRGKVTSNVVKVDLNRPMKEILAQLTKYPVTTQLSLNGTMIVARDIAHAKLKERLDKGERLPQYLKDHPIYYAGPAKTPKGMPSGSFGPTTAGRMDSYVGLFQSHGASMITLAKGNRSAQVTEACKKYGGFYLGSIGGPAAILAQDHIKKVELHEYPELGMEAIWKIEVEDFPAFILVDDKGNDFFRQICA
ncbi:MAG TPA: fumarate hydratase [Candidatus Acidoferrum sp.]|jgi:fumarate hydratase, class I|nr:fumarate hydratase [Candidatus Acidoferrum sp.]